MSDKPLTTAKPTYRCQRCQRDYQAKDFYRDKNKNLMKKCKACMASQIDLHSPSTITPIMEEIDIPFIPEEWNSLIEKNEYSFKDGERRRNPRANQSVLGKYIGKMKLKQYADYDYSDTPRFMANYEEGLATTRKELHDRLDSLLEDGYDMEKALQMLAGKPEDEQVVDAEGDMIEQSTLTKEEIYDLRIKWGMPYTPEELIHLETFYGEMHDSYDITSASHEDYLKQICKLSLRMHSLIDNGMFDEYTKVSNSYDKMMKSAKFTASQEKEEDRFVDSISEMVRLCEEQNFIPLYHVDEPQDIVDVTLKDLENYTYNLVTTELNLDELFNKGMELNRLEEEKEQMEEDDALFYDGTNSDDEDFGDIEAEIRSESQFVVNEEVGEVDGEEN